MRTFPNLNKALAGIFTTLMLCMGFSSFAQNPNKDCKIKPKFDFSIDSCKVNFHDQSMALAGSTIISWYWNFGDGTNSNVQHPTHAYAAPGVYTVCLTIVGQNKNGNLCKEQVCRDIKIRDCGPAPPCKLKVKYKSKVNCLTASFADFSLSGAGTTITNWYWDFGDGNTSTLQNPTHTYASGGTYNVCLTIVGVNANGVRCKDQLCLPVTVRDCGNNKPCKIKPLFIYRDSCLFVQFQDLSLSGAGTTITNWYWDFGDGNTSTMQSPAHTYTGAGTYTVCLTIVGTRPNGTQCKDQICRKVTVKDCGNDPCTVQSRFIFKDSCLFVQFSDVSVGGPGTTITNWYWDFGDGSTSVLQNPSHTFAAPGTYNVCLVVVGVNAQGFPCKDQICLPVTVKDCGGEPCAVYPRFQFSDSCLTVNFIDFSAAGAGTNITTWFWDFGDGNTSNLQNPTHTYAASGTYTVCLTIVGVAADGTECRDQICIDVTVKDCGGEPCAVFPRFQFSDSYLTAQFLDFSAAGPGTNITTWFWNFGDGNTSNLQSPSHTYAASGTYTVCLTIVGVAADGTECKDLLCIDVTVKDCGGEPCAVFPRFQFGDSCLTVQFLDFSTADPGTTITSWLWNFGDGSTSNLQNPNHTYPASGMYTACLTVVGVNADGTTCRDSLCLRVDVEDCGGEPCAVFPRFQFSDSCLTVNFIDFSAAGPGTTITSWDWSFGDGSTSNLQNPAHTYPASGTYTVCLMATGVTADGTQCRDSICMQVIVKDCGEPCLVFSRFQYTDSCLAVVFFDLSSAGPGTSITNWNWSFGDGNSSNTQNPVHVYGAPGTYTACLVVTGVTADGNACRDTTCLSVTVKDCGGEPCSVVPRFQVTDSCLTVNFHDLSTAGPGTAITGWLWNFGDGNTSNLQNVSHTYPGPGAYQACLTVVGVNVDGTTCRDSLCVVIQVQDCNNNPCGLQPAFLHKDTCLTVQFQDITTVSPGSNITSWYWDFGDGNNSTTQHPLHTYDSAGTYTVCLYIRAVNANNLGCEEVVCFDITVIDCGLEPCTINSDFQYRDSCLVYLFTDFSTAGPGTTITSWNWNFGDGTTSNLQNPVHLYTTPGAYTVCLQTNGVNVDGSQCSSGRCQDIIVKDCGGDSCAIFPQFTHNDTCLVVHFIDQSAAGAGTTIVGWSWDFGDGTTSNLQNPVHTYTSSGMHTICLEVAGINANGTPCRDVVCSNSLVVSCRQKTDGKSNATGHLSGLKVMPNPASHTARIGFEMSEGGQANVTVYDMQGKVLTVIRDGYLNAGVHQLEWNVDVPPGVYLVVVKTDSSVDHEQVIIR
ncbi:MAG: PKD domain-containing protein [Flavobacteriales bacterium]|nr:PKD domain-containing protein [Flavobacteriales bacterium]